MTNLVDLQALRSGRREGASRQQIDGQLSDTHDFLQGAIEALCEARVALGECDQPANRSAATSTRLAAYEHATGLMVEALKIIRTGTP